MLPPFDGTRVYVSVLTFKEKLTEPYKSSLEAFNQDGEVKSLLTSKALILVYHYSFIK